MRPFSEIYAMACARHGGEGVVQASLPMLRTRRELAESDNALWLATFARQVFCAGFSWKVVEKKWEGFEKAFWGFVPSRVAMMSPDEFEELTLDARIIRHRTKIMSVRDNASFVLDCSKEYGSFGQMVSAWPSERYVDLLILLKKLGSRLGGNTGAYALRREGVDGFILTRDVSRRLVAEGVVTKQPTSKRDLNATQEAFNIWAEESGWGLASLSRILAMSVD